MADTPTGIMMDATFRGKDVTIYSTTGQKRTEGDFAGAMAEYDKTGKIPKGYTVLEPGIMNTLRGAFESVNQPLQKYAPIVGKAIGEHLGSRVIGTGPWSGVGDTIFQPNQLSNVTIPDASQRAGNVGEFVAKTAAESVNTPGKAGTTAGMLAVAPLLGPVSVARGAGQVALSKAGLLGNVAKSGIAAGTGSVLMDAALGGTEPFDPAKVIAPIVVGAASGGVQGVIGHMINKYIKPDLHEEVAKNILKPIADRYPNYKTDPTLFDAAASSPEKIADITVAMTKGMRGTLDDVANTYKNEIVNVIPQTSMFKASMSVGDQATLRAHMRRAVRAGNEILDNMDNPKAQDIARQALQDAVNETGKFVTDVMKREGVRDFTNTNVQVAAITKKLKTDLDNFTEGAQVLNAFRQSGQQNGFDVMAMRDILVGQTTSGQTDVMGKVAKELGMGQSLTRTVDEPSATGVIDKVIGQHLRRIPGIGKYLAPTPAEPVPRLPWQLQQGAAPRTIGIGVQASGQDAIDSFMNRKSDITINIEKKSK